MLKQKLFQYFFYRNSYRIFIFLFITSAAALGILIYFIPFPFSKYDIKQTAKLQHNDETYFYDINTDGYSEQILLNQPGGPFEHPLYPALSIINNNKQIIDQWNFGEGWLRHSTFFDDYDHDGNYEVYTFTQKKDSLFLYVTDFNRKNEFLIKRAFIAKAKDLSLNPQGIWDIHRLKTLFADCDNDGYDDIVINISSGLSQFPRELVVFSMKKNRMMFTSPKFGAHLGNLQLVKLKNNDEVILANSGAFDNIHINYPYKDDRAWLMVFDKKLNFYFPPVALSSSKADDRLVHIKSGGNDYIAALLNTHGPLFKSPVIMLYDFKGKKIAERTLDNSAVWNLIKPSNGSDSTFFLFKNQPDKTGIEELNEKLNKINESTINYQVGYCSLVADLNKDLSKENIFSNGNRLYIANNDFSSWSKFTLPFSEPGIVYSIKKNGFEKPQLAVSKDQTTLLLSYSKNSFYFLHFLLFPFLFILIYGTQYSAYLLFNSRSLIHSFYKLNFRSMDHGVLLLSTSKKIVAVNNKFNKILGTKYQLQPGQSLDLFSSERADIFSIINNAVINGEPQAEEITIVKDSFNKGKIICSPVLNSFGIIIGYYVELIKYSGPAEDPKLKIWSRTVQQMVHDIKTPLSTIQLNIQTLQYKLHDTLLDNFEIFRDDFNLINTEMSRVRQMTKNFLKYTNLEKPNLQNVSLSSIVKKSIANFTNIFNGKLKLRLELDDRCDAIYADPYQMEMILQVLLENSIESLQGEGVVLIGSSLAQHLDKSFKEYIEIEVADNGKGIPHEIVEKVFDPFFTTKKEGTGMGLSIAKKIISEHGGEINISSREGFATSVRIMLPFGNTGEKHA